MAVLAAPLPTRSGRPCKAGCGREVSPGPTRHHIPIRDKDGRATVRVPEGTCIHCLFKTRMIAIPRGRKVIRGGLVTLPDPTNVPAIGRGFTRGSARRAKAVHRREHAAHAGLSKRVAAAFARRDDVARSTAAEAARRQQTERLAA